MSKKIDAIVVLGFQLNDDGTPKEYLIQRLDHTITYIEKNNLPKDIPIIVTGGVPKNQITEAQCMKNYLEKNGLTNIIMEEKAKDSVENALFVKEILENMKAKTVVVITSDFHVKRSTIIFEYIFNDTKNGNIKLLFESAESDEETRRSRASNERIYTQYFLASYKAKQFFSNPTPDENGSTCSIF